MRPFQMNQGIDPIEPPQMDQGVQAEPNPPPETLNQGTQTNPPVVPPRAIRGITFPVSGGIGGGGRAPKGYG